VASYTVVQGDHLSGIAKKFGFGNYKTIWDHPNNAALKEKRKNPHVLYPGDQLYIPDKTKKTESVPTTTNHRFRINTQPLMLRIALKDFDDHPIVNTRCQLELGGTFYDLTSDGNGFIQTQIPKDALEGMLRIPDLEMDLPLKVGFLDPHEEDSGMRARLVNLGYLPAGPISDLRLSYAVEEFQADNHSKVTGVLDSDTKAKLKAVHGC
jgi:hypothetical protein